MKKKIFIVLGIIIILAIIISITLFTIYKNSSPKIIELTSQNFEDYIIFDISLDDFNIEKRKWIIFLV